MKNKLRTTLISIIALGTAAIAGAGLFGDIITDLLKIGGVGLVVDKLGPQMNSALNKVQNFSPSEERMTRVVPILSVGKGTYIGACQVMGPRTLVEKVKAVAQVETSMFGSVRLKALVPVESKNVVERISRVVGVGISGIIDLRV